MSVLYLIDHVMHQMPNELIVVVLDNYKKKLTKFW